MSQTPTALVADAGAGMLPIRQQKHGTLGETYRCPLHSGSGCSICGGTGYRSICNRTLCQEYGCQDGSCSSTEAAFRAQQARKERQP